MTKVTITALRTFSHGNVDAKEGGTYSMNKGDAQELEKHGFVSMGGDEPEQIQVDQPRQTKQAGDVVVNSEEDLLGDGEKQAPAVENKMDKPVANKAVKK